MPKSNAKAPAARLEARIPAQIYDQMQRAASPRGLIMTGHLIARAGKFALPRRSSSRQSRALGGNGQQSAMRS
jgi:hypothetical protein